MHDQLALAHRRLEMAVGHIGSASDALGEALKAAPPEVRDMVIGAQHGCRSTWTRLLGLMEGIEQLQTVPAAEELRQAVAGVTQTA